MSVNVININDKEWQKFSGLSSRGRRVKSWYQKLSDNSIYLYKVPKRYENDANFITKEIWTEYLASKIGTFLGLDIPEATPAKEKNGQYGIMIKSFIVIGSGGLPANELAEAKERLGEKSHNLVKIKQLLLSSNISETAWMQYRKMLIFDSIIGNNDRHDENWGLLLDSDKKEFTFAPIYDNASCLTAGIPENKVEELLNNEILLNKFVRNSKPPNLFLNETDTKHYNHFDIINYLIEQEPDTLDLIKGMVNLEYLNYTDTVLERIEQIDVPEEYKLSHNRVQVIKKILKKRNDCLRKLVDVHI